MQIGVRMSIDYENKPKVVVFCTSYNHGKYIETTLNSIINQKTNYSFKIVVHDDASTDDSQETIRKFAGQYPDTIIPILQKENQLSKGINVYNHLPEVVMQGKYIAYCECDDFWIDENKLQKQIDYMENHPECSMCVHNTIKVDEAGTPLDLYFNSTNEDRDYAASDVILAGGGGLFHTSSFLYRTTYKGEMPACFMMKDIADYPTAIYFSTKGSIHYFKEVMSAYRVAAVQSWSVVFNNDNSKKIAHFLELGHALQGMDEYTKGKYSDAFKSVICDSEYMYLYLDYNIIDILRTEKYRKIFMKNTFTAQVKYIIKAIIRR